MNPVVELEVSNLVADSQRAQIFAAFDRLVAGETLQLLLSVPAQARDILAEFQERYGHNFDWSPLDNKRGVLAVSIAKRKAEPRTISSFLGTDHHRLTAYWEEFIQAVKTCEQSYETLFTTEKGHRVAVVDRLSQFIFGLRRHIRMEEDHFFPLFEDRSGRSASSGPTEVMRAEHEEIEAILRELEKLLCAGDCVTLIQTIERQSGNPSSLFRSHDTKEETILYPMADRLFTQQEKDDLCLKMQTV